MLEKRRIQAMKTKRDFLSITDLSQKEIWQVLLLAKKLKNKDIPSTALREYSLALREYSLSEEQSDESKSHFKDKAMVMLFEKPSLRTKLSFDVGFNQLGGHSVYFGPSEVGLGKRESVSDVSKVISSMADLIVARVFSHQDLEELSQNSKVPVINALSDLEHPCQALADFLTILENKKKLKGLTLAYLGDGENNVPHSLSLGCALLGVNFKCAAPYGFWMKKEIVEKAKQLAKQTGTVILETDNPKEVVKNADVIYTDTWVSMGDEEEKVKRLKIFKSYQVTGQLIKLAESDAIFMHDMPAYRGNEVTPEVIDGGQSVVFQQAENRLHAQKALMLFLLKR